MADDLDELEAELERLEQELSTIGPEDEEDEEPSALDRFRSKLPFGGREDAEEPPEDAGEAPEPPAPVEEDEAPPEPSPEPEPPEPEVPWTQQGGRWTRAGSRSSREVVVRRLDHEGNVVEEHPTDDPEILDAAGAGRDDEDDEGVLSSVGGWFGGGEEEPAAEDPVTEEDERTSGRSRGLLLAALLLLALVVGAVAWSMLGGMGPGANAPDIDVARTPSGDPVAAGSAVTLDASGTSDPDGRDLVFTWDLGDGTTATGPTVSHTYASAGDYTVTLTVAAGGDEWTETLQITVLAPPSPDLAVVVNGSAAGPANPLVAGDEVTLDASGSTGDADLVSYAWSIDGTQVTGATVTHTFADPGLHDVQLTVADGQGLETVLQRDVAVGETTATDGTLASQESEASVPFTVGHDGLTPARVVVNLTYQAQGEGGLPLPGGGGGAELSALSLNVTDAAGNQVAGATGSQGSAEVTVTSFVGLDLGSWTAGVTRDSNLNEQDYRVETTVVYPVHP